MRLSIIMPTRDLDDRVYGQLQTLRAAFSNAEILVVEPRADEPVPNQKGATTAPVAVQVENPSMAKLNLRRLTATRGRGTQCRAGAEAAIGDILLFLHDDTRLPKGASLLIEQAFAQQKIKAACFRLTFDRRHWLLNLYAWLSGFETLFTTFGDQAMLVHRELYESVDGFPAWPLFEDVELARRLRRRTRIHKLPLPVVTSAERFIKRGMLRQQLGNGWMMLRFLLGASPIQLAAEYESQRIRYATRP